MREVQASDGQTTLRIRLRLTLNISVGVVLHATGDDKLGQRNRCVLLVRRGVTAESHGKVEGHATVVGLLLRSKNEGLVPERLGAKLGRLERHPLAHDRDVGALKRQTYRLRLDLTRLHILNQRKASEVVGRGDKGTLAPLNLLVVHALLVHLFGVRMLSERSADELFANQISPMRRDDRTERRVGAAGVPIRSEAALLVIGDDELDLVADPLAGRGVDELAGLSLLVLNLTGERLADLEDRRGEKIVVDLSGLLIDERLDLRVQSLYLSRSLLRYSGARDDSTSLTSASERPYCRATIRTVAGPSGARLKPTKRLAAEGDCLGAAVADTRADKVSKLTLGHLLPFCLVIVMPRCG